MTSHANDTLIALQQVTKTFETLAAPTEVLRGIDLKVAKGESLAIVGPSGSGKSTLLNLMGVLDTPTSGAVLFDGQDVRNWSDSERARFRNRKIGFVFQAHHLLPQCSVLENVLVPTLVNKAAEQLRPRAEQLLARVGLADRMGARPAQLSGGERQRTAVVRALINSPRLLLADEPTGSLNRDGAEELTALLIELNREEGMALVVVTHSTAVAERMGRALELRGGVLAPIARPE